jgi:RimJ/RimL family protein N-acetyltransferase
MTILTTARLTLKNKTPNEVRAMLEAMPPEVRKEVAQWWVDRALNAPEPDPWIHGFTILRNEDQQPVGFGGFKGPPNEDGVVELAYGIDDEYQNQGFATEMTQALTTFAKSHPEVKLVIAHTLPSNGPSQRVLTKCGFQNAGEHMDPEDGLVWRWESPTV